MNTFIKFASPMFFDDSAGMWACHFGIRENEIGKLLVVAPPTP